MSKFNNPFILPSNEYKRHLDLLGNMIKMYKKFLEVRYEIVGEEAKYIIRKALETQR